MLLGQVRSKKDKQPSRRDEGLVEVEETDCTLTFKKGRWRKTGVQISTPMEEYSSNDSGDVGQNRGGQDHGFDTGRRCLFAHHPEKAHQVGEAWHECKLLFARIAVLSDLGKVESVPAEEALDPAVRRGEQVIC